MQEPFGISWGIAQRLVGTLGDISLYTEESISTQLLAYILDVVFTHVTATVSRHHKGRFIVIPHKLDSMVSSATKPENETKVQRFLAFVGMGEFFKGTISHFM